MLNEIREALEQLAEPERATLLQRYFKTGPGEYGEGDRFYGIRVPEIRKLSRKYQRITMEDALQLLHSPMHEERQLVLFILVLKFAKGSETGREEIYNLYLANTQYINNWDLIDSTAGRIVGAWLDGKNTDLLYRLARSDSIWERRIAIMATAHFIDRGRFDDTLKIATILLNDEHDLIHKAVGWMLREVGKRDYRIEEDFLRKHHRQMPRTMLRYAIERFPEEKRQAFLAGCE